MVEIFQEPELMELNEPTVATEWFDVCSELGLEGQLGLVSKSAEKKAPPYMVVDEKTERIIRALCPVKTKYKEYTASTIPLDVLQEIKKCQDNGWYEQIYIYSDNQSPDPFVVGQMADPNSTWRKTLHLIARWGAELLPWEELEVKATNRLQDECKESLSKLLFEVEYAVKHPQAFLRQMLGGKSAPSLGFYLKDLS